MKIYCLYYNIFSRYGKQKAVRFETKSTAFEKQALFPFHLTVQRAVLLCKQSMIVHNHTPIHQTHHI